MRRFLCHLCVRCRCISGICVGSTLPFTKPLSHVRHALPGGEKNLDFRRDFLKLAFDFAQSSGIYKYRGSTTRVLRPAQKRPRVVAESGSEQTCHDPCHRTAALCVDLHAKHAIAAIGSAGGGTRQPTECPQTPPPVASTARRPSGRAGRLPGDTAVSATTAAALVVRIIFHHLNTGGPLDCRWATFQHSCIGGSFDRRLCECSPRRVCPLRTSCHFAGFSGLAPRPEIACLRTSHVPAANASVFFLGAKTRIALQYVLNSYALALFSQRKSFRNSGQFAARKRRFGVGFIQTSPLQRGEVALNRTIRAIAGPARLGYHHGDRVPLHG